MSALTTVSIALGIVVGLTTILSALWRIFAIVSELRIAILRLENEIERVELIGNGVRERVEHISLRLQNGQKGIEKDVRDLENFLCKTTAYQVRR